jgi:hypothetical protein
MVRQGVAVEVINKLGYDENSPEENWRSTFQTQEAIYVDP